MVYFVLYCDLLQKQHQAQEEQPQMDFRCIWQNRRQLSADLEERRRLVAQSMMKAAGSEPEKQAVYTEDLSRYDKGMIPGYTGLTSTNDIH